MHLKDYKQICDLLDKSKPQDAVDCVLYYLEEVHAYLVNSRDQSKQTLEKEADVVAALKRIKR